MKRALVCGAGGFIGGHLVKKLKREGYWVRGVDIKEHEFAETQADEFRLLDLREAHNCCEALNLGRDPSTGSEQAFDDASSNKTTFDEVYQLAADMGGMGYIHNAEADKGHPLTLCITAHSLISTHDRRGGQDRGETVFLLLLGLCVPGYGAWRAGLNEGDVRQVLLELRDAVVFFNLRAQPVKLEGLGTYTPTVKLDGNFGVGHRADLAIKRKLNIPGEFKGDIKNRSNIGKTSDELVTMWNEEHPDDPVG